MCHYVRRRRFGIALLLAAAVLGAMHEGTPAPGQRATAEEGEPEQAEHLPLVLEIGINGMRQELIVAENQSFHVITRYRQHRWVVTGEVGTIADGVVPVKLVLEAAISSGADKTSSSTQIEHRLKVNECQAGRHGSQTVVLDFPWIRRGLDPVPALVPALRKRNDDCFSAVSYLGKLGPDAKDAVPELTAILQRDNFHPDGLPYDTLHENVARALGLIGPEAKSAVPALLESARDSNGYVRVAAALALWKIDKHPKAVPTLTEALEDEEKDVRRAAATALRKIGAVSPGGTQSATEPTAPQGTGNSPTTPP